MSSSVPFIRMDRMVLAYVPIIDELWRVRMLMVELSLYMTRVDRLSWKLFYNTFILLAVIKIISVVVIEVPIIVRYKFVWAFKRNY